MCTHLALSPSLKDDELLSRSEVQKLAELKREQQRGQSQMNIIQVRAWVICSSGAQCRCSPALHLLLAQWGQILQGSPGFTHALQQGFSFV